MKEFIRVDGAGLSAADAYRLVVGCTVPRPVAWITTVNTEGRVNAAPFSSYNYVATEPPMLAINISSKDGDIKDTALNIRETGEFVVNVATEADLEQMHASGAEYPADVSETDELGIELLPSQHIKPPRIASTPVQMECRLDQVIPLGHGSNVLYIGEIVAFHLSPDIYDGRRVDSAKMRPIARLGGPFYAALGEIFHRPMLQRQPNYDSEIKPKSKVD